MGLGVLSIHETPPCFSLGDVGPTRPGKILQQLLLTEGQQETTACPSISRQDNFFLEEGLVLAVFCALSAQFGVGGGRNQTG